MRKFKFLILALMAMPFVFISCSDDDKPSGPVTYVEDGFYVVGEATSIANLQAEGASAGLMAVGIDENAGQTTRTGLYEKYVALDGGKSFSFVLKAGSTETKYGASLTLSDPLEGGDQPAIQVYKGTLTENGTLQVTETGLYHIILDVNLNLIVIAPVEWGVRGAMNSWGFTALEKPAFNKTTMTYTLKNVTVEMTGGFKFAYGNGWKIELGGDPIVKANTNLGNDGGEDNDPLTAKLAPGGKNIGIERAIWDIELTWTLAKGAIKDGYTAKLTKVSDLEALPEFPDFLYVVGNGTTAGWDPENGVTLYPVNSQAGMFYGVVWLKATGSDADGDFGFKFCVQRAWDGDFGASSPTAGTGEFAKGGDNIPVPGAEGLYTIIVDLKNERISVVNPELYGMGDAFGGWDTKTYAFEVRGTENLVSPAAMAAGNLRAYVSHPWFEDGNWWQSEVNVEDGNIVYRSTGGDPAAFPLTAGQKVDFNFKAGTATVE